MTTAVLKSTAAIPIPVPPLPAPSAGAVLPLPPHPTKTAQAVPRKPYPFKTASLGASNAVAAHVWGILTSKRIALNEQDGSIQNASLAEILERVEKLTGLTFRLDPTLKPGKRITIQISPCNVNECLDLLLDNWVVDFEILSDGTLHVGPRSTLAGGFEREARKMEATAQELSDVRGLMDGGWDGIRDLHDPSELRAKKISIPQGETSLEEELDRMIENQVFVRVDVPVHDEKTAAAYKDMMNRRFLQAVEERTVGEHVEQLARMSGLVAVPVDKNLLCLTTEEKAAEYRAQNEKRRRAYQENATALEKACRESGSLSVQDFLDSIPRSVGVPVIPSEEAWDSGATITLSPGATLREGLDLVKAQGYRWALRNGKILVFK